MRTKLRGCFDWLPYTVIGAILGALFAGMFWLIVMVELVLILRSCLKRALFFGVLVFWGLTLFLLGSLVTLPVLVIDRVQYYCGKRTKYE
jgi:hypothetical protein